MIRNAHENVIRLGPHMASELVAYMNAKNTVPYQHIERLYWAVGVTSIHGVLDRIRTALIELVARLRHGMPEDADLPSEAVATYAVQVAVTGQGNNVTVAAPQASGNATKHRHEGRGSGTGAGAGREALMGMGGRRARFGGHDRGHDLHRSSVPGIEKEPPARLGMGAIPRSPGRSGDNFPQDFSGPPDALIRPASPNLAALAIQFDAIYKCRPMARPKWITNLSVYRTSSRSYTGVST